MYVTISAGRLLKTALNKNYINSKKQTFSVHKKLLKVV